MALALLAIVCLATAYLGSLHHNSQNARDSFIFFDGAWRLLCGQTPHVDFYSGLGFVSYLVFAAGLKLTGGDPNGIGVVRALVGMWVSLWAYWLLRRRLTMGPNLLCCTVLLLLVVSPFPLGKETWVRSLAMFYNRYGYALSGLVFLECLAPRKAGAQGDRTLFWYGLSTGFALAVLLFLKITFFVVSSAFVFLSLVLRRWEWRRLAGVSAGFLLVATAGFAFLRFDVQAFLADMQFIAGARIPPLWHHTLAKSLGKGLVGALALLGLALVVRFQAGLKNEGTTIRRTWLAIWAAAIGGGALLLATNSQASGYPLNALAMGLLLNELDLTALLIDERVRRSLAVLAIGVTAVNCEVQLREAGRDGEGFLRALVHQLRHHEAPEVARIDSPWMNSFVLEGKARVVGGGQVDTEYVGVINDGISLLRAESTRHESVVTLAYTNPFSICLHRPPAEGGSNYYYLHSNISPDRMLSPEKMFRRADLLMVPKFRDSEATTSDLLESYYAATIRAEYKQVSESTYWRLYRRVSTP